MRPFFRGLSKPNTGATSVLVDELDASHSLNVRCSLQLANLQGDFVEMQGERTEPAAKIDFLARS
jgi:hypothetical protein